MTLSERRKQKQMTQEYVAEKLGVDRTTVSKWETGENFPSIRLLLPLSRLYDCTIDELLDE